MYLLSISAAIIGGLPLRLHASFGDHVLAFGKFFYHFALKRRNVIWGATGDKTMINHDFLINPPNQFPLTLG